MKPISFKEVNKIFAENQKEYKPLPSYHAPTEKGEVITCWKLSFLDKIRVLFTGKIWLLLLSFNKPLTPSNMTTKKSDFLYTEKQLKNNKS